MRASSLAVFLILLSSLAPPASAQSVRGRVMEPGGAVIPGALISFRTESGELAARVVSDDEGGFSVERIDAGRYALAMERLGYQTTRIALALVDGDSIEVVLRMAVEAIPMEPITVVASPRPVWEHTEPPALWEFWERKDFNGKLGIGHFFTDRELKPFQGLPVALTVTQLMPFLHPAPDPKRSNAYHIQARMGCPPLIFLDGHPLPRGAEAQTSVGRDWVARSEMRTNLETPSGPLVDDWISLSEIAALEVYRGASDIPGEFRLTGSQCGVVAIWSKRGIRAP